MKKFGLIGTVAFLVFFVYSYKTSGKLRKSILSAFVASTVGFSLLSPQPVQVHQTMMAQAQENQMTMIQMMTVLFHNFRSENQLKKHNNAFLGLINRSRN